jgi:hypothetical protein
VLPLEPVLVPQPQRVQEGQRPPRPLLDQPIEDRQSQMVQLAVHALTQRLQYVLEKALIGLSIWMLLMKKDCTYLHRILQLSPTPFACAVAGKVCRPVVLMDQRCRLPLAASSWRSGLLATFYGYAENSSGRMR